MSKSSEEPAKKTKEPAPYYLITDLENDAERLRIFAKEKATKVEGSLAAVELIIDSIEEALKVHTFAAVAEELAKGAIHITGGTLKQYVTRIRKKKADSKALPNGLPVVNDGAQDDPQPDEKANEALDKVPGEAGETNESTRGKSTPGNPKLKAKGDDGD